jgi:Asp-tRNA(Asn)/Glu-tRNA(Gln) amidotransferase A subunit family amidase
VVGPPTRSWATGTVVASAERVKAARRGLRWMAFEAARALAPELETPGRLSDQLRALLERGRAQTYSAQRAVRKRVAVVAEPVLRVLDEVDAVLAPAALGAAPQGPDATGSPQLSRPWQLLGVPAVTFPAGRDEDGMPLGLQLIGAAHSDDALLDLAGHHQHGSAKYPSSAVSGTLNP